MANLVDAGHPVRVLARGLTGTVPAGAEFVRGDGRCDSGRTKPDDLWNMVILVRSFSKK